MLPFVLGVICARLSAKILLVYWYKLISWYLVGPYYIGILLVKSLQFYASSVLVNWDEHTATSLLILFERRLFVACL